MRNTQIKFLLLAICISSLFAGCGPIKEPEFKGIENTRLNRLGLDETGFTLDLIYFNPNHSGLRLKYAEGGVWIDNNFLGRFLVDTLVRIPASADFRLPVKLNVDMSRVLKNSILVLFSKDVLLKIEGTARLGKAGLYINYAILYEGRHKIDELLR